MRKYCLIIFLVLTGISPVLVLAQEDEFDQLLKEEVENINPVYKPVVGFGLGIMNFIGDIENKSFTPTLGTLGYHINVATYIDNGHFTRANFYFMGGKLTGNKRSASVPTDNFNFQTDIYNFGITINYDFDHLFSKKYALVQPFMAIGIETVLFSSKYDKVRSIFDPETQTTSTIEYHYWTDGTIRDLEQLPENQLTSVLIERDFIYETPVSDKNWGNNDYPEYAFSIPVEIGLDMHVSNRVTLRLANSFHYTFSDYIDHVSSKNDPSIPDVIIGDKKTDWFNFTYVSLHLDLFSSKKTLTMERLFRDVDYDYSILFGDEDNDLVPDGWDDCPGTPAGALVDSLGCPIDSDDDGIPDYRDDEMFSRTGAFVNDRGVEITEDQLISQLDKSMAVGRNEIDLYIRTPESYRSGRTKGQKTAIPQKFKHVDKDSDGYISYDEMLQEIDKYFDFKSNLNSTDIYELNSFFFSQ
ncbi:MAG: hypothetical protein JXB00_02700 [Bacteroidales bacterium]|nr:hypothetical protein [Bacteroidales bacterium]